MRSSKTRIKDLSRNFEQLERLLSYLPITISKQRDDTSLSVWGVLNTKDKESLEKLLKYYKDLKKETRTQSKLKPEIKRELKRIGIKLIRFINSMGTQKKPKIENGAELGNKIKNPGIALEYFLIDIIDRINKEKGFKIEKGPCENEARKVDFTITTPENIKLGVQLTLSEGSNILKKQIELKQKQKTYDKNGFLEEAKKDMSIKSIPDVPVLMIVNSELSRQASHNAILLKAFTKWKDSGFPSGGPKNFLTQDIQNELNIVGMSIPDIFNNAFNFIKENYNSGSYKETKKDNLVFIYDNNRLKVSFYKKGFNGKTKTDFMYSIEIFITKSLLKKLGLKID